MSDTDAGTAPATGTADSAGTDGNGQDPNTAPPAPQQQPANTGGDNGDGGDGKEGADTIARLEKELADARREAGKTRTNAKQRAADEARQELTQQLLGILDPAQAGQEATPEQLAEQLRTSQAEARHKAVELAVYRTAQDAGADPEALLDSRQFATAVADLDPSDTDAVKAAITTAIDANPRLAAPPAAPAPPRGGGEFGGPPSGGITQQQFAAMGYAERAELYQRDPDAYRRLAGK